LKIAKTKKNQNNTENTSRACSLENKVGVLKSSSVKNKKQHRKHLEDCKGGRNTKTTWRMHQEPDLLRTNWVLDHSGIIRSSSF
jgi:hypothetical protein